jgi:hypothetical protein
MFCLITVAYLAVEALDVLVLATLLAKVLALSRLVV